MRSIKSLFVVFTLFCYTGVVTAQVSGGMLRGPEKQRHTPVRKPQNKPTSSSATKPHIKTTQTVPASYHDGILKVNGVQYKMLPVEGGTFRMGATAEQGSDAYDDEKPVHSVTLSSFYIGQTEVTQALWQAVMGTNPSNWKGETLPVEQVSWNDCQAFITKLNQLTGQKFSLPTEAEWEFAARGGVQSRGYKYSGGNIIDNILLCADNSGERTHPVATKQPNELGLYDMTGNVQEWCQDWYGINFYSSSPSNNPTGPASGKYRVLRGGSWFRSARSCRVSRRSLGMPSDAHYELGFRLALSNSTKMNALEGTVLEENLNANANFQKATELYENKEYSKAAEIFQKLANQGHAESQCYLGDCYYYAHGVSKNLLKAVYWYERAASQGNDLAQYYLGYCYAHGEGVSEDSKKAAYWYEKSANQGNVRAQLQLGFCYCLGEGVSKDPQKAIDWFAKSANRGFANAQFVLGLCFYNGEGVSQNLQNAVFWWEKAANQGYAEAQYSLGECYFSGVGTPKNLQKSAYWYEQAANQGHAKAQLNLSECYAKGYGVKSDMLKSLNWRTKYLENSNK